MQVIGFLARTALFSLPAFFALSAQPQQSHVYPETGTVILTVSGMGTFRNTQYRVTSNHAIYRAQCTHLDGKSQDPDCSFNGKTIASGDAIKFRVEGDFLILPADKQREEQKLPISRAEMNPYPETPAPGSNGVENGVIVAVGNYKNEQYLSSFDHRRCPSRPDQAAWSDASKTAPLSPPAGKSTPGNVQVVGGSLTPEQADYMYCMTAHSRLLDSFKLITSDRAYEVTCMNDGPCQLNGKPLQLGSRYYVRVSFPTMWVATDPSQFSDKSDFRVNSGLLYPEKHGQ